MTDEFAPSPVSVLHGPGSLAQLGSAALALGMRRVLLVTDAGIVKAGHADRAVNLLEHAGIESVVFSEVQENPTAGNVTYGMEVARGGAVDGFVALGGGSAMDCAKAINLLCTNGGKIGDYEGEGKASRPLRPLVAVPTTAGTGSEAQSFALISEAVTHRKMVIGDRRAPREGGMRPHSAILDAELSATAPHRVAVLAGLDALSHAVETAATTARCEVSLRFTQRAWELIETHIESVIHGQANVPAREAMLFGAHLAGLAIEYSMLGAAHACANPLTARCGVTHGLAVAVMLPHVIRFNAEDGSRPYRRLGVDEPRLADRVESLLRQAQLPQRLGDLGISESALPALSAAAAQQWTARFNPRAVSAETIEEIYRRAI